MSNSFPCYDSWWQQEKENINPLPAKTTSDKKKQPDNQPIPLRRHPLSDITEVSNWCVYIYMDCTNEALFSP